MTRGGSALRDRWTPELIQQVNEGFKGKTLVTPFPPVPLDGVMCQDLRGVTIRELVRGMALKHVDLSYARVEWVGGFIDATLEDCLFTGATLDNNMHRSFSRCRFDGAKLAGVTVFGGSSFSECTFVKANLQGMRATAVSFHGCDFTGANFKSTHATSAEFVNCVWEGVRFVHASLGHSKITRAGFPVEKGDEQIGRLPLPAVILDHVTWLE